MRGPKCKCHTNGIELTHFPGFMKINVKSVKAAKSSTFFKIKYIALTYLESLYQFPLNLIFIALS